MFYLAYGDGETYKLKAAVDELHITMRRIGVELKAGDLTDLLIRWSSAAQSAARSFED
jgi:hypothetical protein